MVVMHLLRMLADLSFYYSIAGFAAAKLGGTGAFLGYALQALCYTLAALLSGMQLSSTSSHAAPPSVAYQVQPAAPAAPKKGSPLRLLALLPLAAAFLLYRDTLADAIIMVPPFLYLTILIIRKDFKLDYWQQHRLFSVFWKLVPGLLGLSYLLLSSETFAAVSLPYSLIMFTCSVVLLRSLRHDASIYTQRRYQLINLALAVAVIGGALLLSTDWALALIGGAINLVYQNVVVPLLMLIPVAAMALFFLVRGLFKNITLEGAGSGDSVQVDESSPIADLLTQAGNVEGPGEALRWFGTALLVAGIVVGIILVFRWMNRRSGVAGPGAGVEETRGDLDLSAGIRTARETAPVRGIRNQYRKFLKLCKDSHLLYRKNVTSAEVDFMARKKADFRQLSPEIRDIYIRARYDNQAGKEDLQQMKKLLAQAKKSAGSASGSSGSRRQRKPKIERL